MVYRMFNLGQYITTYCITVTFVIPQQSLKDVFRATVESKIQYAAPAWSDSAQRETVSN